MTGGVAVRAQPGGAARRVPTALLSLLLALVAGCANLQPVRDFGRTAATVTAFSPAGDAYLESAVASDPYVRAGPVGLVAEPLRARQVRAATALQASLARYFALVAKLAGDETWSLDAQVDAMGKGMQAVADGSVPKVGVDAALALARVVVRYQTSAAQLGAVQDLVREGGPSAMATLDALRAVVGDWTAQVENDAKQVDQTLQIAVLPADVPPLLRLLADDRRAQLRRDDAERVRRLRAADAALAKIRAAHDDMAAHLDDLAGEPQLRARLRAAAAELRTLGIPGVFRLGEDSR